VERLLEADARWSERLRVAEQPGPLHWIFGVLAHSGDSWFWGIGLALLWLLGNPGWKTWSLHMLLAIGVTAALVFGIKLLVRRRRPPGEWGAIYRSTDPHSFPSGHAARAVLLAILAIAWGPAWLALVLALWAPWVSLARVAMGLHYLSDVAAGAVLGGVMAGLLVALVA
jgi:undecaprenyl-diphosphatase